MSEQTTIRMTLAEFRALPESNLPHELIDGELIVSPTPVYRHQQVLYRISKTIDATTNSEPILSPMDVYLDDQTVLQPDIFWVSAQSKCYLEGGYWHGAPDLVIEILSPSTAAMDRGRKFALYEAAGVREYWLVEPAGRFIEVFVLRDASFQRHGLFTADETLDSPVLGATIDLREIFREP